MEFYPDQMDALYDAFQAELSQLREKYRTLIPDRYVESVRQQLGPFVAQQMRRMDKYERVFETLMRPDLDPVLQEVLLENIHRRYNQICEGVEELARLIGLTLVHPPMLSEILQPMEHRLESLASLRTDLDTQSARLYLQQVRRIHTAYESTLSALIGNMTLETPMMSPPPRPASRIPPPNGELHLALVPVPGHPLYDIPTPAPNPHVWPAGPGPV